MSDETKDVTEVIREFWDDGVIVRKDRKEGTQFHSTWRDSVEVISATVNGSNVKITWKFPVTRDYSNPAYTLHGAAQALFYDNCIACLPIPLIKPGFWDELGFTRNLNINFLRTAKIGEVVVMETELVQIGRSMGYMTGVMRRESDGAVISTCEQNKFNTSTGMKTAKL